MLKLRSHRSWAGLQTKLLLALGAVFVIGGATTAAVLAAIPDSNGVIHACRANNNGAARIIDTASQTCTNKETAVSWNQSGGAGSTGEFVSNLVGADFYRANLAYRNFTGADLHGSIFRDVSLTGSNFAGANFSGATIDIITAKGASFTGANFTDATLGSSGGRGVIVPRAFTG